MSLYFLRSCFHLLSFRYLSVSHNLLTELPHPGALSSLHHLDASVNIVGVLGRKVCNFTKKILQKKTNLLERTPLIAIFLQQTFYLKYMPAFWGVFWPYLYAICKKMAIIYPYYLDLCKRRKRLHLFDVIGIDSIPHPLSHLANTLILLRKKIWPKKNLNLLERSPLKVNFFI